jgi:hypothetical protein
MVIYEHVKGILSVPCYLDDGDYAGYTTDISFTDSDIIRNSCSIKSSACDSSTFSLGSVRPAELSIQLHLEQDGINAYNLYGAKIILYSCYRKEPVPSDWIFRGMFWVTSVSRKKTLYTLRASDALVWLNNNSISSASGKVDNDESEVSKKLRDKLEGYEGDAGGGGVYPLHTIVADIVTWTNDILQNMIAEKPLIYEHIDSIPNDSPKLGNPYSGYTLMRKSEEGESKNTRYSAIDYISALAKPACSFVCMRNDRYQIQNNDLQVPFSLVPFGFFKDKIRVPFSAIARDSCDVASYNIYIQKVHFKTYDDAGWTNARAYKPMLGNAEIDLSSNCFFDGRRMETVINYNNNCPDTSDKNECQIVDTAADYLFYNVLLKPFQLKCYLKFDDMEHFPKLGQRIEIEYQPGKWAESTITNMTWKFRGGWEFSCTGKDTRVLAQAAKRSLAFNSENASKRHADIVAAKARKAADNAWGYANGAYERVNQVVTEDIQNLENNKVNQTDYDTAIAEIWNKINSL